MKAFEFDENFKSSIFFLIFYSIKLRNVKEFKRLIKIPGNYRLLQFCISNKPLPLHCCHYFELVLKYPRQSSCVSFSYIINQSANVTRKQLEKCFHVFFFPFHIKLFGVVKEKNPDVLEKMVAVEGDVGALGMGLSNETLEELKDVSVIFHSAASVRFDDILKSAIILNTRGTHEVIKFALTLNNLASFVHVSTTYCYPDQSFIDEKVNKQNRKV